jgi:1-deoxy-D-xylulose-5-phosphate synthase
MQAPAGSNDKGEGARMDFRQIDPDTRSTVPQARPPARLLDNIDEPSDLRRLPRQALTQLSQELRAELIEAVSKTGGHFGAGLGVVELTVALHWVLDTPADKLIWDVSHQSYPHKILTGRRRQLRQIRQGGGISGFTSRRESDYDPFGAAHSSTAISAGLGFAAARDLGGENFHVVSVVGDAAMSGGLAYEGLNNAGGQRRRLVIVLNDNDMSIAGSVGALAECLRRWRSRMPDKAARRAALERGGLPSFVGEATLFDDLGITYAGPFDGHDVDEMVEVLSRACAAKAGPVILHVLTDKGHGYAPAMASSERLHSVNRFVPDTGEQIKAVARAPSYTGVFAKSLIAEAKRDPRVVAITAAMPSGTGLDVFGKAFPDRCFDAAIAEQHAVTFCAGLACQGFKPFATIYSTFLQRAYDQIVHDVAIQRLPVRFAIDRAGLVGADGVTHQGSYDIAYLGCLPGFVLMAAADEADLARMVATAVEIDDRPSALRYPRGEGLGVPMPLEREVLEIGRGRIMREGGDVAILSYGSRLADALAAADSLAHLGITATVADARFAKPIDDQLVARLMREHPLLVTIEEGAIGGFATQVVDSLTRQRLDASMVRLLPMHLPDLFIDHDSQIHQAARAGLDADAIRDRILSRLRQLDVAHGPQLRRAAE